MVNKRQAKQNNKRKIIIIAPHPDDEIFGCGGMCIKAIMNGFEVFIVYLTSGEESQDTREKEALCVCEYLNISGAFFLRLHEGGFIESAGATNKVISVFEQVQPNYVFVCHDQDADKEHKISYHLTTEAIWRYHFTNPGKNTIKGLLLYEVHEPMRSYNMVEDISTIIDQKRRAMSMYSSQLKTSRTDLAIEGLNRFRGTMHENVDYAEVFQIKKMHSLFSNPEKTLK